MSVKARYWLFRALDLANLHVGRTADCVGLCPVTSPIDREADLWMLVDFVGAARNTGGSSYRVGSQQCFPRTSPPVARR